jgi:acetylornithine deacetylase/succinyl-diaminopimelate desuccinylase-like protein
MDAAATWKYISEKWDSSITPTLTEFIKIPNQSPSFDPEWNTNGLQEKAVDLFVEWVKSQNVAGLKIEVLKEPTRTPVIFIEVDSQPAGSEHTVLMYGHLDKQPPLLPWAEGLGPYTPVIKNGRLYGRGGADDGYAIFGSITAITNLHQQKLPHARCLILIEGSEESGSPDLPHYVQLLAPRIKIPDLVVCLDSGAANYEHMWCTTSLRGLIAGVLKVNILREGVHSGVASGIAPSSFRIIRQLLDRIEDSETGKMKVPELVVEIPAIRRQQIAHCAKSLGSTITASVPFVPGAKPVSESLEEQLTGRTWQATLSIIGVDGIPDLANAGNVLRPMTAIKLSIRVPPGVDAPTASKAVKKILEENPPYGATVSFECDKAGSGWNAPDLSDWAEKSFRTSSETYFGKPAGYIGEGGSIPLIGMLADLFPNSQFCVTGVLGPESNAHGPNEFIDLEFAKKITCCVSQVLADHHTAHQ